MKWKTPGRELQRQVIVLLDRSDVGEQAGRLSENSGTGTGGERGIRTLDTLLTYTHFPGVRLQPLGHLSAEALKGI